MPKAFPALVLASHNSGKIREISALLAPWVNKLISSSALQLPEPEETADSFDGNARLKAEVTALQSGLPALADDSGLVIPALDGAPGIYSARWAGPEKQFTKAFARIQQELSSRNAPIHNCPAYFICALALVIPGKDTISFEGRVEGTLTFPPRGEHGFGYDPIFVPVGHTVTFGEMPGTEKQRLSHRARALEQLIGFLSRAGSNRAHLD